MEKALHAACAAVVLALLVGTFWTGLARAEQKPEMKCSVASFVEDYNKKSGELMLPGLSEADVRHAFGTMESHRLALTPFSVVTMMTNPGRKSLASVLFNGAGDGTPQSGSMILASVVATFFGADPWLSPDELNALLRGLGLMGGVEDGARRRATVRELVFSSRLDPKAGLMVWIEPAK